MFDPPDEIKAVEMSIYRIAVVADTHFRQRFPFSRPKSRPQSKRIFFTSLPNLESARSSSSL